MFWIYPREGKSKRSDQPCVATETPLPTPSDRYRPGQIFADMREDLHNSAGSGVAPGLRTWAVTCLGPRTSRRHGFLCELSPEPMVKHGSRASRALYRVFVRSCGLLRCRQSRPGGQIMARLKTAIVFLSRGTANLHVTWVILLKSFATGGHHTVPAFSHRLKRSNCLVFKASLFAMLPATSEPRAYCWSARSRSILTPPGHGIGSGMLRVSPNDQSAPSRISNVPCG